jgi:prepilin-type N-terminal cleavage/methylation domain-containing protein
VKKFGIGGTKLKSPRNTSGFSLVELLVVVAIIGILAVIGIPSYYKFKAKAYQSEAKVALAAIHTGQRTFFLEYQGYHSSLQVLGYAPMGRMRYNVGFGNIGITPATYSATYDPNTLSTKQICSGAFGAGSDLNCDMIMNTPSIDPGAIPLANSYLAMAVTFEDNLVAAVSHDLQQSIFSKAPLLQALFRLSSVSRVQAETPIGEAIDVWAIDQNNSMTNFKAHGNETCYVDCVIVSPPPNPNQ